MSRRFIRGIPVSQVRRNEPAPWAINVNGDQGRDPERCTHCTRVRGIAVEATDEIRFRYGVPPNERCVVFLPNDEPDAKWRACSLCGSLRNPAGVWITLYDKRTASIPPPPSPPRP